MGRLSEVFKPIEPQVFARYIIDSKKTPPLALEKLESELLEGDERKLRIVPVTGDTTLYVNYKGKPGVVVSMADAESDLSVLQLQGATGNRSEGYRVSTGLAWVAFFADQIKLLGQKASYDRLTMPPFALIEGLIEASEDALIRYRVFAQRTSMSYSEHEQLHVLDLK